MKKTLTTVILLLIAMAAFGIRANAEGNPESEAEPIAALEPLQPGVTENDVFAKLVTRNETRNAELMEYASFRTYRIIDTKGRVHAQETGEMEYRAPDKKTFAVLSVEGSGIVRRMAFGPLIASEIEAAAGKDHRDSSITPENYSFVLLGEQQVGPHRCFVAQAIPKRRDKFLFEGKVWIDIDDYAIVRIEGHPAKKLSFWIERADFVRQYEKIGPFWLPERDETFVQVKFYGKHILSIDHENYTVNPGS